MLFFVNDIPFRVTKKFEKYRNGNYDLVVNNQQGFKESLLAGNVLIISPSIKQVLSIVNFLQHNRLKDISSLTILSDNKKELEDAVKNSFRRIDAAGGLVQKDNKFLLIHRLGVWDLPKGKLDDGESLKECAVREVEEECCVKVDLFEKITETWHTYTTKNGNHVLKMTAWYSMVCTDDSEMKPQIEESIEDIRWMDDKQVAIALNNSYNSIKYVFEKFKRLKQIP